MQVDEQPSPLVGVAVVALLAGLDLAVAADGGGAAAPQVDEQPSPLVVGFARWPAQPASRRLKTRLGHKGDSLRMTLLRERVRDGPRRVP